MTQSLHSRPQPIANPHTGVARLNCEWFHIPKITPSGLMEILGIQGGSIYSSLKLELHLHLIGYQLLSMLVKTIGIG